MCNNIVIESTGNETTVGSQTFAIGPYYGRSENSTATACMLVSSSDKTEQSDAFQMRGGRGASPASTYISAPNIIAAFAFLLSGSGEIPHISEASAPNVLMQAGEPDIDINYNDFSSLADSARLNLPKRISRTGAALAVVPSFPTRTYMSDFFDESS
jgi:hypothetical protein